MDDDLRRRLEAAAERGLAAQRRKVEQRRQPGVPLPSGFEFHPRGVADDLTLEAQARVDAKQRSVTDALRRAGEGPRQVCGQEQAHG